MCTKCEITLATLAGVIMISAPAMATPGLERRAEARTQAAKLVAAMTPEERLSQAMMDAPAIDRLGIPAYHWWNEALHGIAREGLATVFPQAIGMAASFDPELLQQVGDVTSTEARAKYNLFSAKGDRRIYRGLTLWCPNINMFRDPRWGRGQETYGEDPFLTSVMGGAYTRGLQGDDAKYLKTAACAKHFAVHSGPESLRHRFSAKVSKRDMAEYYLPAFKSLVQDSKVESLMSAYTGINGTSCTANKWLLTDLLRGEWGFQGHVVSDVGAVNDVYKGHRHASDQSGASQLAIAAGLDLCSEKTYRSLSEKVRDGSLPADLLVEPVTRLYTTRALLGMFDPKGSTPWDGLGAESISTPAHQALALKMAEESLVLISNKNNLLPLDMSKNYSISVIGPYAWDDICLVGNYCGYPGRPIGCLSGMALEAGPACRVMGFLAFEPDIDVGVVCLGYSQREEGECSDRKHYGIPESHMKELQQARRKFGNRPMITVVFGGSPIDLKPIVEISDAVILAWYPGEQGGAAIARTILGKNNPSGRLPMTYPVSYDDLPDFKDYSLVGRTYRYATKTPAYPFGYGLSYTTFAYAGAQAKIEGELVKVSVQVTNTGKRAGDEVVQAYVRAPASAADRRIHHLEGIRRVNLAPGETKTVTLELPKRAFEVFDEEGKPSVPSGESIVFIGGGQPGFADVVSASVNF